MASTATVPWADTPLSLIHTPEFETNRTDVFTTGATHMCLVHNAIFRGYNSIRNQAAHINDGQDKADFIGYSLTWCNFVKAHHDDEENSLFPVVQELLKDSTIWDGTQEEHASFVPQLMQMRDYLLQGMDTPLDFEGDVLLELMAAFEKPFEHHFRNEIATIAALADHPNAPKPGSPEEDETRATFRDWGRSMGRKIGMLDGMPFFLLNMDRSTGPDAFEEGRWANWPPIPGPVRWGIVNIAGAWNSGWWQFASCDSAGLPQTLYALREGYAEKGGKEEL